MAEAEQISNPSETTGFGTDDLPAPPGWKKQLVPKKSGTPKKDVVFIAPTGEEFKAKRPLERHLKANPGGPSIAEFDWSTAEVITPTRRSARISEKVKESPVKTPDKESKKTPKRPKKSEGDSEAVNKEEAEIQEAEADVEKEEEMQDVQQGREIAKAETGDGMKENKEDKEEKEGECKPGISQGQEDKVEEPKTVETAEKTEEKLVAKTQSHPFEGIEATENEEKHKVLKNKNENGPAEDFDQEKHSEHLKAAHHELSMKGTATGDGFVL